MTIPKPSLILGALLLFGVHLFAQPANNNFASATAMAGTPATVTGSNVGATRETGEPYLSSGTKSVWWKWTPTINGVVTIDTIGSAFDTVLGVYVGSTVSSLLRVASDDDSAGNQKSRVTFIAYAGTTYRIMVQNFGDYQSPNSGSITIHLAQSSAAPANDNFTDPDQIGGLYPVGFNGFNDRATKEPGERNHAGNAGGHSVWWTWYASHYGKVTVSTAGSVFDTLLAIYAGNSVSNVTLVASDDDGGTNFTSLLNFNATYGTAYRIAVDGWGGATGKIALNLEQEVIGPTNDFFTNRITITGLSNTVTGWNVDATDEEGEPLYARSVNDPVFGNTTYYYRSSVWWTWTAPTNGRVTLDTTGSSFTTGLGVFTGEQVSNLTAIAQSDGGELSGTNQLTFVGVAGTTYQIAVYGISYNDPSYPSRGDVVLRLREIPSSANDFFAGRIVLTGTSNTVYTVNTNATTEPVEPLHSGCPQCLPGGRSLWWSWTSPMNGVAVIDTIGSSVGTFLAVYTGDVLSNLTAVARNAGGAGIASKVIFAVSAGAVYQIAVDDYYGGGNIVLNLRVGATPPNDSFSNRMLMVGTTGIATGNNQFASSEPGEPISYWNGGQSVWWTWTAPFTGVARLDTLGSSFRNELGVYTGSSVSNLTLLAQAYGSASNSLTFSAQLGSNYHFAVYGHYGESGDVVLNLDAVPPPPNDNFADRILIPDGVTFVQGNGLGATLETNEPSHVGRQRSIWWKWIAPANGPVRIVDAGSNPSAVIDLYTGNSLLTLTNVDSSFYSVFFDAVAGTEYQIAASGFGFPGDAAGTGDTKIGFKLFNWQVSTLTTNIQSYPYPVSFNAVFKVGNAGYDSPVIRLRLVAVPGFSSTESFQYSHPPLPANQELGTFPVSPVTVAPGTTTYVSTSGTCPAPNPVSDQNFAVGWSVVAVLEQQVGTNWFVTDEKYVFTGVWPTVSGFPGPGGGVITINPGLSGGTFNPITLSSMTIAGPANVSEGTSASYFAVARFSNGEMQNFTNAGWSSSLPSIAAISTNGVLTTGKVTSNTVVSLSVPYSYFSSSSIVTTNVTVMNLPPPKITSLALLANGSRSLVLSGVANRSHVLEVATNLTSSILWTPLVTNTTGTNGLWNLTDSVTNLPRRFYRAREQ